MHASLSNFKILKLKEKKESFSLDTFDQPSYVQVFTCISMAAFMNNSVSWKGRTGDLYRVAIRLSATALARGLAGAEIVTVLLQFETSLFSSDFDICKERKESLSIFYK